MTTVSQRKARSSSSLLVATLGAAAFSFLCLLALGAVLVIASKLQAPGLGSGASPLSVLKTIAVVSLGALGVPIAVGDVTVQALPLGGLLVVVLGTLPAARRALTGPTDASDADRQLSKGDDASGRPGMHVRRRLAVVWRADRSPREMATWMVGLPLGLGTMCALAAGLSSFSVGRAEVAASVAHAGLLGGVWGIVIGSLGLLLRGHQDRHLLETRPPAEGWSEGVALAGRALTWFGALSLAVVAVGGTVRAVAQSPSPPAAAGALVHGAAFAPNLALAAGALALGAPVEAGFAPLAENRRAPAYSLTDWRGQETPAGAWALALIPAVSLVGAGMATRKWTPFAFRRANRSSLPAKTPVADGGGALQAATALLLGATLFSAALGGLALVGEARIGLDAADQGFAHLAPDAPRVFLLALGWSAVGLTVGRTIRGGLDRRRTDRNQPR